MKPSDNFSMAVTPCYVSMTVDKKHYNLYAHRRGIDTFLGDKGATRVRNEQELWDLLSKEAPEFLSELAKSEQMYHQGLTQRAEMHLNYSPSYRESMEAHFHEIMLRINGAVLEAMDARVRTKKAPVARRTSTARGLSWWEVKSSCSVPHLGTKPSMIHVRMFPSPLDEKTWSVRVRMPVFGLESLMENQRRIKQAFSKLESLGIDVEDVVQGSWLDL